ncbi:hypothetical protein WN51_12512 [Melipona quadrifasciata]|uniref:Uncharacterized protein n=1 Tax=Melipona quadrifasciata TaxID=166423 RepID=A0A0M9A2M3_9HYME|nr:hypothetical protein WN51_12512 [Melipona quadrifasciata]
MIEHDEYLWSVFMNIHKEFVRFLRSLHTDSSEISYARIRESHETIDNSCFKKCRVVENSGETARKPYELAHSSQRPEVALLADGRAGTEAHVKSRLDDDDDDDGDDDDDDDDDDGDGLPANDSADKPNVSKYCPLKPETKNAFDTFFGRRIVSKMGHPVYTNKRSTSYRSAAKNLIPRPPTIFNVDNFY